MSRPQSLKLLSYLAPNMFWFYEAVGAYLERVFALETQIVQSVVEISLARQKEELAIASANKWVKNLLTIRQDFERILRLINQLGNEV